MSYTLILCIKFEADLGNELSVHVETNIFVDNDT